MMTKTKTTAARNGIRMRSTDANASKAIGDSVAGFVDSADVAADCGAGDGGSCCCSCSVPLLVVH